MNNVLKDEGMINRDETFSANIFQYKKPTFFNLIEHHYNFYLSNEDVNTGFN